jgi:hypothetical protein
MLGTPAMNALAYLDFGDEHACLTVRARGPYFIVQKRAAIKAIANAIEVRKVKAALVDVRGVTGPITFMDRYQLGELAGEFLRQAPFAVLALEEHLDAERIGWMVARNRGANVEVFTDPAEAGRWLQPYLAPVK